MVGKYVDLTESYKSLSEALIHAGIHTRSKVHIHYVDSEAVERDGVDCLKGMDAILVPGGFGKRGVEGKIAAIRYARENGIPYLGICLGMQLAVIEYARHMARARRRQQHRVRRRHAASGGRADHRMAEPRRLDRAAQRDSPTSAARCASARSRARSCPASLAHRIYGATTVAERHRHRYEVNNHYLPRLEAAGLVVGARAKSATAGDLCEMIELPTIRGSSAASSTRSSRRIRAAAIRCSSASCRRRSSASGAAHGDAARGASPSWSRRSDAMKLCGFEVGLDRPLFLIAGPCVVESRAAADRRRRRAEGNLRGARRFRSSSSRPTTRRIAARRNRFAASAWRRACASSPRSSGRSACRC